MISSQESFLASLAWHYAEQGMPPAAGRMLGWLLLQPAPCSLDEVVAALAISKSAVSSNARILARAGAIEVSHRPNDRRDYYEASAALCENRLEQFIVHLEALGGHLAGGELLAANGSHAARRLSHVRVNHRRAVDRLRQVTVELREAAQLSAAHETDVHIE
jgi:hypothetical protein